ncbi:Multi antimicrobial extrusion protein [Penicillium paradoxum]|uniref:Multi antimicrobial extrusion protein n=1 Tax=Penicillium paradoxum TaxID=176176 RepID=UPI002547BE2F|nr:Multi antimicrobial extrusion protein [Penicillium paradoxum]KAJ5782440.1 Multi antimicrobial extrusion protein [Penicillium paradoxum]
MHVADNNGPASSHPPADEYTSLLSKPTDDVPPWNEISEQNGEEDSKHGAFSRSLILAEFWILLKDSIPVILAYTLQNSLQTVSVLIIGRSSPHNLATSAFSLMFAAVTGWMIALGGTTALDTLASSSFTGSANKHDLGILLQRGFLVLGLFYIPVAILWAFSEPVFLLLGQDPQLSHDSARFLTCLIPGGLGYIYFEVMKKYLQAQGIMRAGTYVLMITSPLNAVLNYLFCYTFEIGLLGAPLATGFSYWLSFALLVLYARFVRGSECWGGWSREAFQNLGTFSRLALLGVVQVGTEWWAFEIVALAAGRLGTVSLAAQSVIMTADQVLNTIPFGIGVATSARIGNLLGSRDAIGAARAAHTSALLSMVFGVVVLAVLVGTRENFARIFNDDLSVVRLTADVLPYVALFQIADGLNGSCGGSLRGMGRQHVGALVNLVSYYCGALPLGIWLAFHGMGLKGLWVGQCIALYLVGIFEWIIVARSEWDEEVRKAFRRMDVHECLEAGVERD